MKTETTVLLCAICILFGLSGLGWAEGIVQIPIELTNRDFLTNAKWTDASFIQGLPQVGIVILTSKTLRA